MTSPETDQITGLSDRLFTIRDELEALTRRYIESLLVSGSDAAEHATSLMCILGSVADPILVFDKEQKIILANHAAALVAGVDLQNMNRRDFHSKYHFYERRSGTEVAESDEPLNVAMRERRSVEMEGKIIGDNLPKDGLWIRVHAAPIIDGSQNLVGGVSVFQNITERVNLERQRDALGSLITHDLKNQLVAASMVFELMIDGEFSPINEKAMLVELKDGNDRFISLATMLLELQRTQLAAPDLEVSDIGSILNEVFELNLHMATLRKVKLVMNAKSDLRQVKGFATAWRQVFHNFVQNAISVSADKDCVQVNALQTANCIVVEITDNGPGIDPETFCEPRTTADSSTGSSGFGIYLSCLLIKSIGGNISCRSATAGGTTIEITVPLAD